MKKAGQLSQTDAGVQFPNPSKCAPKSRIIVALLFSECAGLTRVLSFTEIFSNALELGPLRKEIAELLPALLEKLECMRPAKIPRESRAMPTLIPYSIVSQPDTDWVVLPVVNFDAYFRTASFGKKYLSIIPPEIIERPQRHSAVSRYRVRLEYLPDAWAEA